MIWTFGSQKPVILLKFYNYFSTHTFPNNECGICIEPWHIISWLNWRKFMYSIKNESVSHFWRPFNSCFSRNLLTKIKGIKIKVRFVKNPDWQGFPEVSKNSQIWPFFSKNGECKVYLRNLYQSIKNPFRIKVLCPEFKLKWGLHI